jgi:hypothetical protein
MPPAVEAAYGELLTHGAGCLECRQFRDEDGKSTGQCPELDALAEKYRQAQRDARDRGRTTRTCGACHRPIHPNEDCTTYVPDSPTAAAPTVYLHKLPCKKAPHQSTQR